MFIQSLKYDYQTGGILVEYVTKAEARKMSANLSKAIFGKGELEQFDGLVTGIYTVENYLMVGTDAGADEIDQIIEFIKDKADPDQYDENDYEQKGTNEDFSMGVEGPTGLNQGIPHGGPGKGVIPAPLFGKGKPMSREEQKEDKKKLKKALDALDLYGVKVKKVTEAMPEYFCRNPWTIEDVDHYLYHDLGFESGEVDDLIALNLDLINDLLEKGKSPEEVADALDYYTVQDAED